MKSKLINKDHKNINKYLSKNPLKRFMLENYYSALFKAVGPHRDQQIIDVGAGEGFTLHYLKEKGIGKNNIGIDRSKESIRISKILFPGVKIEEGDIYKLPFKDKSFDLVMCLEVLEHLDNPQKGLSELKRITKKNIILSVPREPFFMLGNFLCGKNIKTLGDTPEHINHWSKKSFVQFIKNNKLNVKSVSLPFPWILVSCEV